MRIIGVQGRVSPFLIAVVLLLQLSPALATGQPYAQPATIQGARRSHLHEMGHRACVRPRQLWHHGRAGSHGGVHRR